MKIIFSPAKEMDLSNPIYNEKLILKDKTKCIINKVNSLEDNELKKALNINENLLNNVLSFYENIEKEPFYKGLDLYNGLSFRQIDKNFNNSELDYLNNHLLILSALYGIIKPFKLISSYRLDMNSKIKIDNKNLKNYWKEDFNKSIEKDETIINLASDEFSSLFNRENFNFIDFEFYRLKDNILKSHSTTSKKGRGIMLNFLIHNKVKDIKELKNKEIDKLELREFKENKLVYILKD